MSFRLPLLAIVACLAAVLSFGAPAQADEWAKEQEKTNKDWNVTETPDGAMYQVLSDLANFDPPESWGRNACEKAALNRAWDIWGNAQGVGITQVGADVIKNILSNIWGLGKDGLEEYVTGLIKDGYKGALKDKIKGFFEGRKKPKADVYKWASDRGHCDFVMYVIVDVPDSKGTVLIHGNCNCSLQRCYRKEQSVKLAGWEIKLEGKINYKIGKDKIESVSFNDIKKVDFKAVCEGCDTGSGTMKKGETPSHAVNPGTGTATGGGGTTGGGTNGGGTNGGGATDGGGKAKPEEKTCPPCEQVAKDLDDAETRRDNLKNDEQNLKNNLVDVENGLKPASARSGLEKQLKSVQDQIETLNGKIRDLQKKKDECEKKKCSLEPGKNDHASYMKAGAAGYAARRAAEEAHHTADNRGEVADRPVTEDAPPQRDPKTGCVASAAATSQLPPGEREAARAADKARLDAEVSQREAEEKQASKKYDDAIAELERRRYASYVTSDETYASQKNKLRSQRRDETASYHDATIRARACRDNYLKAAQ